MGLPPAQAVAPDGQAAQPTARVAAAGAPPVRARPPTAGVSAAPPDVADTPDLPGSVAGAAPSGPATGDAGGQLVAADDIEMPEPETALSPEMGSAEAARTGSARPGHAHAVPSPAAKSAAPGVLSAEPGAAASPVLHRFAPSLGAAPAPQDSAPQAAALGVAAASPAQASSTQGGQAVPTPPPGVPSAAASAVPPTAPAAQLGHALAALHVTAGGISHTTIRLDPAELGQVQVRITRGHDGAASVSVAVERPETLRSLQADLGHLHQALDRAGVPEQRSLSVHLAPPDAAQPGGPAGGPAGGPGQGGHQQGGGARQDRGQWPPAQALADAPADRAAAAPAPARWMRAGINITA